MQQRISAADLFHNFSRLFTRLNKKRIPVYYLAILVAYALIRSLVAAATLPFWFDEICTHIVTRQPTVSRIWAALERAADGQAPVFYLVERMFASVIRNEEVAFRLPMILGFCVTTVCVFIFVRRSAGGVYALVCAAIPLITSLFTYYATEARPYSLVVACVSIALVCYQRAPGSGWMLLLSLVLAFSLTLSYYAVFVFVPFGLAELTFLLTARHFRWRVWTALAIGCFPLAILWPLLAQMKNYYVALPFARPSLSAVVHIYGSILGISPAWGVAIFAVISSLILGIILFPVRDVTESGTPASPALHEQILALALLGLPVVCLLLSRIVHSGLVERYVLSAVLGIPLAAAQILPRMDRRSLATVVGLLVSVIAVQEVTFWKSHKGQLASLPPPAASVEDLVATAGYADLPLVVSDAGECVYISHYASPTTAKRLVCLVDAPASLIFAGDDVMDKELSVFQTIAPLRISQFADFVPRHQAFLLYSSNGSGGDPHDWWAARLVRDGYNVRVVAAVQRRSVFLVTRPDENK